MNWYRISQIETDSKELLEYKDRFFDIFGKELIEKNNRKIVSKEKMLETLKINLYRNFDANLHDIERLNENYVLSPEKSEQGVIWFAHDLQSNPRQYYDRGAKYLLTYPLPIQKEYNLIKYEDGKTEKQNIFDGDYGVENSNRWGGYILPDGFLFSYKAEKHIICDKKLIVSPEQITIMDNNNELV